MVVCVKMMSKGSKEALTVLIVTHVTLLMLKGSKVVFVAYVHNIDTFNAMSKGSKKALTVLIVTHVTHVEKGRKWCLWLMYTILIHSMLCQKGQKG